MLREIIIFILGAMAGALTAFFIVGATTTNRENDVYMEGFYAGKDHTEGTD